MDLKVFIADSLNPYLNIATEEWIFNSLDSSSQILYLWRNQHTVVIGRNQNPWSECNLLKMKQDGITLARRNTGGGAVFHDLGNTNFTFLSPKDGYKRESNIQIILDALKKFNIHGEASGRNDLLVPFPDGPRKFSGSAYREKKDRAFHHGTLLFHADLTLLGNYLTPNPKKLQAKGKESVRARVANLQEINPSINHEVALPVLIESFENFYGGKATIEYLNMDSLQKNIELKAHYEQLSSWNWLYGQTLDFNHKMDDYLSLGFFDFHFFVESGIIKDVQIFTDCLYPLLIEDLTVGLRGQSYAAKPVLQVVQSLMPKYHEQSAGVDELAKWLAKQVEA